MKKIKIFAVLAMAATALFAACDKIEEENYITFSGAAGTWYDGTGVADKSQRAFIEKYTGPGCFNCPMGEEKITDALAKYGEKLVAVSVHDSSSFGRPLAKDAPDMRTPDGEKWSAEFNGSSRQLPSAMVNRGEIFNPVGGVEQQIDPVLAQSAKVAMEVSCASTGKEAAITVNLEFLENVSEPLNITLVLIESGIVAPQMMPDHTKNEEYVHNHILRDVITDVWGAEVDADGKAGTKRYAVFPYTVENEEWNLENCQIIAFISNRSTKAVLNVAECEF